MKYWNIIFCILGILPLGFVIPILLFYFHAGQLLGRLPRYNQPDPKELDIYSDYSPLVDLTGKIWLISFPVWLILTITYLIFRRKHIQWTPIAISGALQLLGGERGNRTLGDFVFYRCHEFLVLLSKPYKHRA